MMEARLTRWRRVVESLRARLLVTTVVLFVVPVILVVAVLGRWTRGNLEQQSLETQQQAAVAVESEIRAKILEVETQLVLLDEVIAIRSLTPDEQRSVLHTVIANNPIYQDLSLVDVDGEVTVRASRIGSLVGGGSLTRIDADVLERLLADGGLYFGPVVFDAIVREPLATLAIPLYDLRTGRGDSALVASIRFKQIWDLLGAVGEPVTSDVYVVTEAGTVIAHRNPAVVLAETAVVLPESDGRAAGLSGADAVIATQPLRIGRHTLTVVAEQPTSAALRVADRAFEVVVGVAILGLLLAIALVVVAVRHIVRPIEGLAESVNRITDGDLTHRADTTGPGEVGLLARSFNTMTDRLGEEIVSLEDRVMMRTQELEQAAIVRDQLIEQLEHQAANDFLTGLPNRYALERRLEVELVRARRRGTEVALFLLDLDDFKGVNDTFGHPVGDELLMAVGRRLQATVRDVDAVCRLGGDEFAIVQPDVDDESQAAILAERLLAVFGDVFALESQAIFIGVSVGVATSDGLTSSMSEFMQRADLALYRAKGDGRNTFRFFERAMDADIRRRTNLSQDLRGAVDRDELFLEFQPQVGLADRRIVGVEALLRWRHPRLGIVGPTELVPIAESSGLIDEVGAWVLREACMQARRWRDDRLPPLAVAVNVSAVQLRDPAFVHTVSRVLDDAGLEPHCLELELTETVLMETKEHVGKTLETLHDLGAGISLDDFGRGYASLDYVRRYPLSKIKIDRSFVQEMLTNSRSAAVVSSVIELAASLDLQVVAEGVEPTDLLRRLVDDGCDAVQGFYFSRPVSADEIAALVTDGSDRIRAHRPEPPPASPIAPSAGHPAVGHGRSTS